MSSDLVGGFLVELCDGVSADEAAGAGHAIAMLRPVIEVVETTSANERDTAQLIAGAHAKSVLRDEFSVASEAGQSARFGRCKSSGQWMLVVLDTVYYEDQAVHIQNAIGRIRAVMHVHPELVDSDHSGTVRELAAGIRKSIVGLLA